MPDPTFFGAFVGAEVFCEGIVTCRWWKYVRYCLTGGTRRVLDAG